MSETEINSGMLKEVRASDLFRRFISDDIRAEFSGYEMNDEDIMLEISHDGRLPVKVARIGQRWFEVHNHKISKDMDLAEADYIGHGYIKFHTCHYNGGGTWEEVIEEEVERAIAEINDRD